MKITLKLNKGFSWYNNNYTYIKGYFYDGNNNFYEKEQALNYFKSIKNKLDFKNIIRELNGVFTIITTFDDNTYIFSDITRSFPVFYTKKDNVFFLSDDIFYLKTIFKINDFDTLSEIEFKASNHTYGKKTLLKEVYQIQASECLVIKKETVISSSFFYSYAVKKENNLSHKKLKNNAILAFENSFKRFISSLNNKTVVIPLSGGFDSRLIAVMLKKYEYKNVICYTYGKKNSFEINNSKKTAATLGFKWYFIEYSDNLITNFLSSTEFKNYVHFAGKLSSMPNLQEYFAVKHLSEKKLINKDSVFIPGYAGDLLGGSQILKVIPENLKHKNISQLIISKKFTNYKYNKYKSIEIRNNIDQQIKAFDQNYLDKIPSSVFEDFDIKEKIAKYIFNSANFYTFFNYEFRFPFWDKELLDFFKSVPFQHKKVKLLFDDVLINNYFKKQNVYFETELQPSKKIILLQNIKDKIKTFLPNFIKTKFLKKNDWINYHLITSKMVKDLNVNNLNLDKPVNNYNQIIIQWYLFFSKNKIQ